MSHDELPPMTDQQMKEYLSVADREGPVPEAFASQLWAEIAERQGVPIEPVINADEELAPVVHIGDVRSPKVALDPTPAPIEPVSRWWRAPAAAAVLIVALLGGLWLTQSLSDEAPVASVGQDDTPQATSPTTTTSDSTTPSTEAPIEPAVGFAIEVGVVELAEESISITFASASTSAYSAVVHRGDQVVSASGGTALAGEQLVVELGELVPATNYDVSVTLTGPPSTTSEAIAFRTPADPDDPGSFDVPIRFENVELSDGQIELTTNVCSEVSYVLLSPDDQTEVARQGFTESQCALEHALNVSELVEQVGVTPPLTVIIEAVETDGNGPNGNVAITSVEFTR